MYILNTISSHISEQNNIYKKSYLNIVRCYLLRKTIAYKNVNSKTISVIILRMNCLSLTFNVAPTLNLKMTLLNLSDWHLNVIHLLMMINFFLLLYRYSVVHQLMVRYSEVMSFRRLVTMMPVTWGTLMPRTYLDRLETKSILSSIGEVFTCC